MSAPILSAIVAMATNRVIGKDNQLPWYLPADLQHFKRLTTGHPILMGRKTYESIGKPLPHRMNIVMTQNSAYQAPGCQVVTNVNDALQLATAEACQEIFVIGGAEIYRQLLPKVQKLYITFVQQDVLGDTFFPELKMNEWQEVSREKHEADEKNAYAYHFVVFARV